MTEKFERKSRPNEYLQLTQGKTKQSNGVDRALKFPNKESF